MSNQFSLKNPTAYQNMLKQDPNLVAAEVSLNKEKWKTTPYEGYLVSNHCRVYSIKSQRIMKVRRRGDIKFFVPGEGRREVYARPVTLARNAFGGKLRHVPSFQ